MGLSPLHDLMKDRKHADRPCYADPRERIELSFEMRPAAYTRILAQREGNAKWNRLSKVRRGRLRSPCQRMASIRAVSA